ncbi:hypothetical protein B0J17DRAFT_146677 [Rhizoctonia solani]|nr:hypothetical protein B0J17DRAFT_146677 [Rhizoctonia solani]
MVARLGIHIPADLMISHPKTLPSPESPTFDHETENPSVTHQKSGESNTSLILAFYVRRILHPMSMKLLQSLMLVVLCRAIRKPSLQVGFTRQQNSSDLLPPLPLFARLIHVGMLETTSSLTVPLEAGSAKMRGRLLRKKHDMSALDRSKCLAEFNGKSHRTPSTSNLVMVVVRADVERPVQVRQTRNRESSRLQAPCYA